MIQHEEIIGLMKGTVPYTNKTLFRLANLIEEYPYFQTAHLLHTLNLLYLKDTHFLLDLRKTAIYVPDRKQLFLRVENDFFDSNLIETLEKKALPVDSPFEIIESFLSVGDEKKESKNIQPESPPVSTDYASFFLSKKTSGEKEEAPPFQHQDTIDKFLEKNANSPLKIRLNPAEESPEELPEPAFESPPGESFFTETLAKIYIKQKKYNRALEIFRKLSLNYPEKSRYFADQIRFLEKLIIYTNKIK